MAGERERLDRKTLVAVCRSAYMNLEFACGDEIADLLEADAAELAIHRAKIISQAAELKHQDTELARKDKALQAVEWYLMKGGDAIKIMDKVMAALASPRNEAKDKECTVVHSEDPSAPAYLALGAVKVTRERCG